MCWTARDGELLAAEERARAENERLRTRAADGVDPARDPGPPGNPEPDREELDRAVEKLRTIVAS